MVIFQKLGEGDFQTFFGGEGGGPFDHTWGLGMNFADNGRGTTLFHLVFCFYGERDIFTSIKN